MTSKQERRCSSMSRCCSSCIRRSLPTHARSVCACLMQVGSAELALRRTSHEATHKTQTSHRHCARAANRAGAPRALGAAGSTGLTRGILVQVLLAGLRGCCRAAWRRSQRGAVCCAGRLKTVVAGRGGAPRRTFCSARPNSQAPRRLRDWHNRRSILRGCCCSCTA